MNRVEIIAEIGQNHNGDIGLAIELIQAAKEAGADVAKFQVYDARALFPKDNNPWYEYNCSTELSREDVDKLKQACDELDIEFMASVFDVTRINWLESIGAKRYKVASRSIHDKSLIQALESTGKDLLVSLGYWKESFLPKIESSAHVTFLHCISEYPTSLSKIGLQNVDFNTIEGFSDHTEGLSASLYAMSLGAKVLERHFTIDKSMVGPDHLLSVTPDELSQLTRFRDDLVEMSKV